MTDSQHALPYRDTLILPDAAANGDRAWLGIGALSRGQKVAFGLIAVLAAGLILLAFDVARQSSQNRIEATALIAAQSRAQGVASVLATQRAVVATLADDQSVADALLTQTPEDALAVSRKLERLHHETGSSILYLLGNDGIAIAASNYATEDSFVGGDYAFRHYFTAAIAHGRATEYALGINSNAPGLYLSDRIMDGDRILGVIVVKMAFADMEANWAATEDLTLVTDDGGMVMLTSDPDLRFGAMPDLGDLVTVSLPVPDAPQWQLTTATHSAAPWQSGLIGAGAMAGVELVLLTLVLRAGRARRIARDRAIAEAHYRQLLEDAVAARTKALTAEVNERREAESRLAHMQSELVQANKLATLGQVTAGLAHEVNQPLGTIRLLADNAAALIPSAPDDAARNMARISQMTERIAQITTHLRGFARKATGELSAVVLQEVLDASVLLTASRRKAAGASLIFTGVSPTLKVRAEAVRLEQVLVNLIQNANEALEGRPDAAIAVSVTTDQQIVTLRISDNGPGFDPDMYERLFMPFATSKSSGLGLGLVIARDIARDLGGDLVALPPRQGEGATFLLTLVRA